MYIAYYKVYGDYDWHTNMYHRQRESFNDSYIIDLWESEHIHIRVLNSDLTGTNMYTILIITSDNEDSCMTALESQLTDGIFENSRYSKAEKFELTNFTDSNRMLKMIMKLDFKHLNIDDRYLNSFYTLMDNK